MASRTVAVVGGGIVGLCVAESLARRGAEVVLVEADCIGGGASMGNAGWVSPGISVPLPAPGLTAQALRWMLDPGSPLYVRPSFRPSYLHFLWDFRRSTNHRRYFAGTAALTALSKRVIDDYDALAARCGFEMHQDGLLCVGHGEGAIAAELGVFRDQQAHGYVGRVEVLDREQALAREPNLGPEVAGAILAADERHVRPESVVRGLVSRLRAMRITLYEANPVHRLMPRGGGWALECGDGVLEAESVVVAAGSTSARLLATLDVRLPLQGAKGYSLTRDEPAVRLRGPVYLLEAKVAVSPYRRSLRAAGTLELGSASGAISQNRVEAIERALARSLPGTASGPWRSWAGFRPLLPDGLPAIGPVPGRPGLHVATGHAMLGVTQAPTTGELLAPVVLGEPAAPELAPFSIGRFGR
jgi:D-amino-acid dehydrogenase